jgi:hypothetical protein
MIYAPPCREKNVDETVGVWFIFGEHTDGTVDICDGTRDVAVKIPHQLANQIISAQADFRERLYALVAADREAARE